MLPARKFFGQNFMPDFFNDLFDNVGLEGRGFKSPAINVIEDDDKYCIELAAPGMSKDDFKVHVNKDGNLVIEMEKKTEEKYSLAFLLSFLCMLIETNRPDKVLSAIVMSNA